MLSALVGEVFAEELRGKITAVTGQRAQITLEGELAPNAGDATTIYFKLPGGEEEVVVGNGTVVAVNGNVVSVTMESTSATPQKDQLARIESKNPQSKSSTKITASVTSSPTGPPAYSPPAYAPKLGVAAAYNCDDGAGDTLTDNSNNGRPMKLYGGLGFTAGKQGQALNFKDSRKLYAQREKDDSIFNFADRDFTIELSCNFRDFAHEQVLLEKFSERGGPGWTLTLLERTKLQFYAQGAGSFTVGVNLKPNQWYRFSVNRRGSRLQMSVDDAVVLDEAIAGAVVSSPNPLLLGRRNEQDGRGFPLNGAIDDVRIDVVPPRRE